MQTTEEKVNELLTEIKSKMKEMNLDAEKVFLNGNCGNMYTIFANYFSNKAVVPYLISYENYPYHIVTQIDGELYDITGKTSLDKYVDYVQKNNEYITHSPEKFDISKIEIQDREDKVRRMSDMYDYDENYNQSSIMNQMNRLKEHIKGFKASKENENNRSEQ